MKKTGKKGLVVLRIMHFVILKSGWVRDNSAFFRNPLFSPFTEMTTALNCRTLVGWLRNEVGEQHGDTHAVKPYAGMIPQSPEIAKGHSTHDQKSNVSLDELSFFNRATGGR